MRKSLHIIALGLLAAAQYALADSSYNAGTISNTVKSSAIVSNGVGTSVSHAAGSAYATAGAYNSTVKLTNPNSGSSFISGNTGTNASSVAYNISTGVGTGSASSDVKATANAASTTNYSAPGQSLALSGNSSSASLTSVTASKNQDGFANTETNGNYYADGKVGSVGQKVDGFVYDNKQTSSSAAAGRVTFTNPVNTTQAINNASSNTIVNATGSFSDPQ